MFNQNQTPENQKNLLLAIVLSMGVLLLWQYFYAGPKLKDEQDRLKRAQQTQGTQTVPGTTQAPGVPAQPATPGTPVRRPLPAPRPVRLAVAPSLRRRSRARPPSRPPAASTSRRPRSRAPSR